jgi:ankyrin repeat protein
MILPQTISPFKSAWQGSVFPVTGYVQINLSGIKEFYMKYGLVELIEKYHRSPEFIFVDLTGPNQKGLTGDTLLHAAVVRGSLEDVEVLLASGALVDAVGDLGNTALHHAASRGHVDVIRKLLQCGASVNTRNEFGETPLDLAKLMKRAEAIEVLRVHRTA